MFPRQVARTTITVYNYLQTPEGLGTFTRTILSDCLWRQDSEASYRRTGVASPDDVKLEIPYSNDYFSVQNGEVYTGEGWTMALGPELLGSYVVKWECPFEFPRPEDSLPPEDLIRNYVQPFEKSNKYKRPKEIIEHFEGTRGLWFIEVRL